MVLPTSSRIRLWMRWDTVILSLKRRKRRDAIGSVGMPVWIDHNKTRAVKLDARNGVGEALPPFLKLVRIGGCHLSPSKDERLFLPFA